MNYPTSTITNNSHISLSDFYQINRIDYATYTVLSQSGNGEYVVCLSEDEWRCECPDHKFRSVRCKHICAVEFSLKMREQVKQNLVIHSLGSLTCVFCGSDKTVKDAKRHNKYGDIQRYLCKACRIKIQGNNKWLTLIQNASQKKPVNVSQ